MAAGQIIGSQTAVRAIAATPMSVVGGVFVTTMEMATKITSFFDAKSLPENVTLRALGYIGEDGPSRSASKSSNPQKAWGGDTLLTTYEGAEATVTLPCAEYLNPEAQKMLYGEDNVTWDSGSKTLTIHGKLNALPPHVAVVIMVDTDSAQGIIVYDDAQANVDGDFTMDGKSVTTLPLTLNLRPVKGDFFREFWKVKDGVNVNIA